MSKKFSKKILDTNRDERNVTVFFIPVGVANRITDYASDIDWKGRWEGALNDGHIQKEQRTPEDGRGLVPSNSRHAACRQ